MPSVRCHLIGTILCWFLLAIGARCQQQPNPPAAALAEKIAAVLGPAQSHLVLRNLSSIPTDQLPPIRRQIETELKSRGISLTASDAANTVRITLSESGRKQLWVAEILEGNESHVVMVAADRVPVQAPPAQETIVLSKRVVLTSPLLEGASVHATAPLLTIAELKDGLVVMTPDAISTFAKNTAGWKVQATTFFGARRSMPRDPRGAIFVTPDGNSFTAFAPGVACFGTNNQSSTSIAIPVWNIQCNASDDPWLIQQTGAASLKAFYNADRNYFTGLLTPSIGVDLPPFFSAAPIVRSGGSAALLVAAVDGTVKLAENGTLRQVSGTRDWGSDFAVISSACGSGQQIIASSSGEALADSLRGYEIPAQEAIPVSAPLTMNGTVTALWNSPDGKSAYAVMRTRSQQTDSYEVDRVTASCD